MADADPHFAVKYLHQSKNIDDCITYILNRVQKSGCAGFTDDEIFGMAAHYYDEDKVNIGKPIDCQVVVNHKPELTPEEIEEAKRQALEQVMNEQRKKLTAKRPTQKIAAEQLSLL